MPTVNALNTMVRLPQIGGQGLPTVRNYDQGTAVFLALPHQQLFDVSRICTGLVVEFSGLSKIGKYLTTPISNKPFSQKLYQKIDNLVIEVNISNASDPAWLLPLSSSAGDHTQMPHCPGKIATMPPPTPLFAGSPTRNAKSPAAS